jgi:hypothetical protein
VPLRWQRKRSDHWNFVAGLQLFGPSRVRSGGDVSPFLTASTVMDAGREQSVAYADEVLCANWHPLVLMLAEPLARVQKTLELVDAENFLARLYSSQQA